MICEDILLSAAKKWEMLCNKKLRLTYGIKGKLYTVVISFHQSDFAHLAGFQYLRDIRNIPLYHSDIILNNVLSGKITEEMLTKGRQYQRSVLPRLKALASISDSLNDEIDLYRYDNRRCRFYTSIRADYLIELHSCNISFFFIIDSKEKNRIILVVQLLKRRRIAIIQIISSKSQFLRKNYLMKMMIGM